MPAVSRHPIEALLSQVEKGDFAGDKGADDNNSEGPVAIVGLVVAALTLLVAIVSLRSSRFRRWASCLSTSKLVKVYLPPLALRGQVLHINFESYNPVQKTLGITPQNPAPTITTREDLYTLRVAGAMPRPVYICNHRSDVHPACGHSNTPPRGHNGNTGEDGGAPQAEESLGPKRPEPVVTR
ncbi:hypothetical protein HOY80DRAFT_1073762 [Tuber brumale]|nr:hypothetical protein HOY80DRAFT_1073762 [Tuber brumale]